MKRSRSLLAALALIAGSLGCGSSHSPQPEPQADPPAATRSSAPQAMPMPPAHDAEPQDGAGLGLAPPPVMTTNGRPPPDPACPTSAPEPNSPCSVAPGQALSCAWDQDDVTEQCACVSKEDNPPGAEVFWNCDDGASGEGPSVNTCPDAVPTTGTPCLVAGNNCGYANPGVTNCRCKSADMQWDCSGDSGPRGGP